MSLNVLPLRAYQASGPGTYASSPGGIAATAPPAPTPAASTNTISPSPTTAPSVPSAPLTLPVPPEEGSTGLESDTTGLLPTDWDIVPWNPSMYARAYESTAMGADLPLMTDGCQPGEECFRVMPMTAYGTHKPDFMVEEFSPAYFANIGGHNIPTWAIVVGGGLAAYIVYRTFFKRGRKKLF